MEVAPVMVAVATQTREVKTEDDSAALVGSEDKIAEEEVEGSGEEVLEEAESVAAETTTAAEVHPVSQFHCVCSID